MENLALNAAFRCIPGLWLENPEILHSMGREIILLCLTFFTYNTHTHSYWRLQPGVYRH